MRRFRRFGGAVFFFCIFILGLTACKNDDGQTSYIPTPSPSVVPDADGDGKIETRELTIDTIDISSNEVISATAYIPADEEITPEVIVREVVESLSNNGIELSILSVTTEGKDAIISFDNTQEGLMFQEDESLEYAVLDSLSYSILDNLNEVEGIIFRIGEDGYVSESIELLPDERYTWR